MLWVINPVSIESIARAAIGMPHGVKVTQLFLHICHLQPAPSPCLYLLAAAYLSLEGLDLELSHGNILVGLPIMPQVGSNTSQEVLVSIWKYGVASLSRPNKGVMQPNGKWHQRLLVLIHNGLSMLHPFTYLRCTRYLLVLFYQFYDCLPFMCTTGPSICITRLILDLAAISILSSYSPYTSYLPYLPF